MKLRGVNFGKALDAAGVRGFFGEGYPHYNISLRRPHFRGSTLVSKTATLYQRQGNIKCGFWEYLFPSWAKVKLLSGHTLNAMGLPNPGIEALLKTGIWQTRKEPFFISIMAVQDSPKKRIEELRRMVDIIGEHQQNFSAPFGLQINMSCPNVGHDPSEIVKESSHTLYVASVLGLPLMLKYAIDSAPITAVSQLHSHPCCDAICVSNTVKFGASFVDWKKIWGTNASPLAHLGGGGLSGPALLPHVCVWIEALRNAGFAKPINGGGGIFCKKDVEKYRDAGANSIFVGTVATYHPRRVAGIIQHANNQKWRQS